MNGRDEPIPDSVHTFDQLLTITRERDTRTKPKCRFRDHLVLRDTSKSALWAEHSEFLNSQTGEPHHAAIKISTSEKSTIKNGNKYYVSSGRTKSIWISDDREGELERFRDFLLAIPKLPEIPGDYLVVPLQDGQVSRGAFQNLFASVGDGSQLQMLTHVLNSLGTNPDLLNQLMKIAAENPEAGEIAAASLNLARYSDAIDELQSLIVSEAPERQFQSLLEKNPWMFGSEYSERLSRRDWVRDQQSDFMMRRTVDNYLEMVEIKTPFPENLFNWDNSHRSWYPSATLSQVIGQVVGYLDEIDAGRDTIERRDKVSINKMRAKIIIGLDHNQDQIDALRRFNSHLHRIEIFTFDQLLATACRARDHLQEVLDPITTVANNDILLDEVPF